VLGRASSSTSNLGLNPWRRKGQKRRPQQVIVAVSNDGNDEKADESGEVYVATAEHNFEMPDMIAEGPFRETSQSNLSKPLVPCQTQAQGLHHDEKFHDAKGLL
jgi:hypothetical protein